MCWRVGSGKHIRIWNEAWVSSTEDYMIQLSKIDQNLVYVLNLIEQNSNCWKEELIRSTFHPEDAERILWIPLPIEQKTDRLLWRGEASRIGEYNKLSEVFKQY
ncbi:Zinc finger CCCH domain-containing protein 7 [Gossypium australe]|uniref:Zinc finger CCCH domain-containing protein 7 n=1 Tax=Gossypium australe TaxID=47621 RepID=A0A5B6WU88_9ROSI|nr:Zinc finger CCCH domain-containing protein 7 [Gossypium australe]